MNLKPYASRKFIITCSVIILVTILRWYAKIEPTQYRDIIMAVVAIYSAANVTQKKVTTNAVSS